MNIFPSKHMKRGTDKNELRKTKNNIKRIVFSLLVLLTVATAVYAHSGRTDSAGGHTNHSTGEYHYHHGYDDHQHYDMNGDGVADCPYKFKDNTTRKIRGSSSTKTFTDEIDMPNQQKTEEAPETKADPVEQQKKSSTISFEKVMWIIFAAVFFVPLIFHCIAFVFGKVRDLIHKLKKK